MQYLVIGSDGKEYGPAEVETLTQWVTEGRLHPQSSLKDASTGAALTANQVPGLFPQNAPPVGPPAQSAPNYAPPTAAPSQPNWSQPPSPYLRQQQAVPQPGRAANIYFWNSIARSGLALVFFFALGGIGVIFGAYAVYYGFRAMQHDHKHGKLAFGFSVVAMLVLIGGWVVRFQHGGY